MLGVVVGREKETKNRIEYESGAHIQLLSPAAESDDDSWTCRITGGHDETLMAAQIIEELIDTSEVCTDLLVNCNAQMLWYVCSA